MIRLNPQNQRVLLDLGDVLLSYTGPVDSATQQNLAQG